MYYITRTEACTVVEETFTLRPIHNCWNLFKVCPFYSLVPASFHPRRRRPQSHPRATLPSSPISLSSSQFSRLRPRDCVLCCVLLPGPGQEPDNNGNGNDRFKKRPKPAPRRSLCTFVAIQAGATEARGCCYAEVLQREIWSTSENERFLLRSSCRLAPMYAFCVRGRF